MKYGSLFFMFIFYCNLITAQEKEDFKYLKHEIGVSIGFNAAVGRLASSDFKGDDASFGYQGYALNLDYHYRLNKRIALSFLQTRLVNTLNEATFETELVIESDRLKTGFDVAKGNYVANFSLAGVKLIYGESDYFYINPMVGYGQITNPELSFEEKDAFKTTVLSQQTVKEKDKTNTICAGMALGAVVQTNGKLQASINVAYYIADFDSSYEIENVRANGETISINNYSFGAYQTINFTVGLKYSL